jgi:hypothetical protein
MKTNKNTNAETDVPAIPQHSISTNEEMHKGPILQIQEYRKRLNINPVIDENCFPVCLD